MKKPRSERYCATKNGAVQKGKSTTKINPFELHTNNSKFTIVGQRQKDGKGIPGLSRDRANKMREKTLLVEYQGRHKSNVFKDKRIGENNASMDLDKKIMLRVAAEKKHQFSKKNIFNLNEGEELTHGGKLLAESMQDTLSDDEEEDDVLDAKFVQDQHFGGGDFLKKSSGSSEGLSGDSQPKSRREKIEEIIADSKLRKCEVKKDKIQHEKAVSALDSKYNDFMSLMAGKSLTDEDKELSKKTCEFRDYDIFVRRLMVERDKKAMPSDRLKTPEEVAKQEKERLERLEEERCQRMKGDVEGVFNSSESTHTVNKDREERMEKCDLKQRKKDKRKEKADVKGSVCLTESGLGDGAMEFGKPEGKKSKKRKEVKFSDKTVDKDAKEELPYTFQVPEQYESFWEILEGRSTQDWGIILSRMVACNHPRLGGAMREKCSTLFNYLLQTLHAICGLDIANILTDRHPLEYVDILVPFLYTLTQLSPKASADSLIQVIDEKYKDFLEGSKTYPYADTFVFLKISGLLFPASDAVHQVTTRVTAFLSHILAEAKIKTRRDLTAMLFSAFTLFECIRKSKRFSGELLNALKTVLYLSVPTSDSKLCLPYTRPCKRVGPESDLLVLNKKASFKSNYNLTFASLNEEKSFDTAFKLHSSDQSLNILLKLTKVWSHLPSCREIFHPVQKLLEAVPLHLYPPEILNKVNQLKKDISKLPPAGYPLFKRNERVDVLKMVEPEVERIYHGSKSSYGKTKDKLATQKLMKKVRREQKSVKRELKRDAQFIARERLREEIKSDVERKRKVNLIMGGLATQEHEHKKRRKES